ncbi:MAG: hypothetical protein OER91_10305 [Gammaproteobacteria bacterium]|nr:hypothetical protein [Gammaproteobacteria bacterium]
MDTLASKISHKTLDTITSHFGLSEVPGKDGGPFLPLIAAAFGGAPAGSFRLWDGGDKLQKVVYTGITVEAIGLDSHMIFAFTSRDSLVPTFTLDSVYMNMPPNADPNFPEGGDMYAFHLDLVPKCDLGVNADYMRRCYVPMTEIQARVLGAAGIFPAQLSPMQHAIMSPWMLAQRTTSAAYDKEIFPAAEAYLNHWLAMVDDGLGDLAGGIQGEAGATRDAANRELIFNREIDPVWNKIDGMLGKEISDFMIGVLRNQAVETEPAL